MNISGAIVREILLHEWDPVGIKNEPNAQDEYDSYIKLILHVVSQNNINIVATTLINIEIADMNLPGNVVRAARVAKMLCDARSNCLLDRGRS